MPDHDTAETFVGSVDQTQRTTALRLVVSGQIVPDHGTDRRVNDLLSFVRAMNLALDPIVAAWRKGRMECACAAVITPGRTALLYLPPDRVARRHPASYQQMLRTARDMLWPRPVILTQALVPTGSPNTEQVLTRAEFRFLAELVYQERRVDAAPGTARIRDDLTFVTYAEATHALFIEALERSYEDSLDCPALTGLRATEDVLATHRAAGRHDPALWCVACAGDAPMGVLLLSQVLRRPALEVVYMGVVSSARGQGIGHALLARAVGECAARHMSAITLAVDDANHPALRMYQQWGFTEMARRRAWIVTRDCPTP